jgi:DNA-binding Xre family transcriptional regulator
MTGAKLKIDPSKLRKPYLPPTKPCGPKWSKEAQYEHAGVEAGRDRRQIKTSRPPKPPRVIHTKEKLVKERQVQRKKLCTVVLNREKINALLSEKRMPLRALAKEYGSIEQRLYAIINADAVSPATCRRLARALGVQEWEIKWHGNPEDRPVIKTSKTPDWLMVTPDWDKVREILMMKEIRVKDLAKMVGISPGRMSAIFASERVRDTTLQRIAGALEADYEYLIDDGTADKKTRKDGYRIVFVLDWDKVEAMMLDKCLSQAELARQMGRHPNFIGGLKKREEPGPAREGSGSKPV